LSMRLDDIAATLTTSGATCASRDNGDGSALFLCTYLGGYTIVTFLHNAGTVTYQSSDYSKVWNGSSYDENTYVVNDTTTQGIFANVQSVFAVNLHVTDGNTLYVMNG